MKALLFLLVILGLSACQDLPTSSHAIVVMYDRTSLETIETPSPDDIWKLWNQEEEPNDGVYFAYQNIGNTDFNKDIRLELKSHTDPYANEVERKGAVDKFTNEVESLIDEQNQLVFEFQHSSIFRPLIKQLDALSKKDIDNKTVLLYSDLEEHSEYLSWYNKADKKLIQTDPEAAALKLTEGLSIPDFRGVTLRIVHYPKTTEANTNFNTWIDLYRIAFRDSGLIIIVGNENE
ncbi:MAG: hypothetical protein AB8B56_10495 [Crocinitomicaceae bacterium]